MIALDVGDAAAALVRADEALADLREVAKALKRSGNRKMSTDADG